MELTCFEVVPGTVELRPAPRRRAWMDATPRAFAYHCLPLVIANEHGWEMLCPIGFSVVWRGGPSTGDLEIALDRPDDRPWFVGSHFGSGILSFVPMVIMRTAPGINLWISGPVNAFKDGIQPLTASVETDWMPFTFAMNWKVTRADAPIRFERGEPFCSFFPVQRGLVSTCEPRLASLDDDPELARAYRAAVARREQDEALSTEERDRYQRWYAAGKMPDGASAPSDHETRVAARPFER